VARRLSAKYLYVTDAAAMRFLGDPNRMVRNISLLRLIAGLPTLYEASGAVYEDPALAERAKQKARAWGSKTGEYSGIPVAEEVNAYLKGEHADDPSLCERLNNLVERFGDDLSEEENNAVGYLYRALC
jgi:hypothetical protein